MAEDSPVVYILHGNDEYGISEFLTGIRAKYEDPSSAEMNTTRLDGRSFRLEELSSATHAMPFLAERRLVVLTDPLSQMRSQSTREKFLSHLETIPPTTAMVLVVDRPLVDPRQRRRGKQHWLEGWAESVGERAYVREFSIPQGREMARWIREHARELGGEFSHQAAELLASLVGDDPRLAVQEIEKLLAYANFTRPVEVDDVEHLTPYLGQGDVFAMVDSLGNKNPQQAQRMLHRLLEDDEPLRLFGMVVRQFRLLLLTKECLNAGYQVTDVARQLKIPPFVARKMVSQASHFPLTTLEDIYRRLLDVDASIKTGRMEGGLALDTLIVELTA